MDTHARNESLCDTEEHGITHGKVPAVKYFIQVVRAQVLACFFAHVVVANHTALTNHEKSDFHLHP